jgi:hypothetical protein
MPHIWPYRMVDSEAVWRQAVVSTQKDISAGLPVKNQSLSEIDPDAHSDLKMRRALLEQELGCFGCVRFGGE